MVAFDPVRGTGNSIKVCCGQLGLTVSQGVATMAPADTFSTGRGNPFLSRRESAVIGVFLCLSFSAAIGRVISVMTGCFGQRSALAVPRYGFPPHYSPSPDTVESISGGYSRNLGVTA